MCTVRHSALQCAVLYASVALVRCEQSIKPSWPRKGEEWVPQPEVLRDGEDSMWEGKNQMCSAKYGNELAYYIDYYTIDLCLNKTAIDRAINDSVVPVQPLGWAHGVNYSLLTNPEDFNESTCARACFARLPLEWSNASLSAVPPDVPLATPDLNESATLPLDDLFAVWDDKQKQCMCFGKSLDLHDFGCAGGSCGAAPCWKPKVLQLPLGCLWSGPYQCKKAPRNSCVLYQNGCCTDSKGRKWPSTLSPAWMLAMLLVPMFFISFLRMIARNLQVSRRALESDNSLETELIDKHKLKYEIYLQKLLVDVPPGATISQCSICLLDLTDAQCGKFPCGHKLHYSCMKDYIMFQIGKSKKKYPECCVCRQRVLLDDESESDVDIPERIAPGLNVVVSDPAPTSPQEPPPVAETASSSRPEEEAKEADATPPSSEPSPPLEPPGEAEPVGSDSETQSPSETRPLLARRSDSAEIVD